MLKNIHTLLFLYMFFLVSALACSTETDRALEQSLTLLRDKGSDTTDPLLASQAEFVLRNSKSSDDRKQASEWLRRFGNWQSSELVRMTREEELSKRLGELVVLKIENGTHKCNLKKGYYLTTSRDSAVLAYAAKKLAAQLFSEVKTDSACQYEPMSAAYLYMSKQDFANQEAVAGATIAPNNRTGEPFVNSSLLNRQP